MNPYYSYALAFSVSLIVYQFDWSHYFPPLSTGLLVFLGLSIVLSIGFGKWLNVKTPIIYSKITKPDSLIVITIGIYLFWILEFIQAGGIPLILMIMGKTYDYRLFGIPTLHVIIVTFSSFFTSYLFHVYLSTKSKSTLLLYLINMIVAILIMNRGMLLLNASSSLFIYFLSIDKLKTIGITKISAVVLVLITLFGVLGHVRVSHALERIYDRSIIYEIGEANDNFKNNIVPTELFWTYLYVAQPLGTLQYNIDHSKSSQSIGIVRYLDFINSEWVPDFISKRIYKSLSSERKSPLLIAHHLNASSVYSRSFYYLGWMGLVLMLAFILLFAYFYIKLISKDNPYFITSIATLCTLYMFLIFDNFFVFSGFSFQLVYPFILDWKLMKRKNQTRTLL